MKCNHCQADLPEEAEVCTSCGNVPTEPKESTEPAEAVPEIIADATEVPTTESITVSTPAVPSAAYTPYAPPAKKKGLKIALIAVAAVAVLVAVVVFVYLQGADGRVVDEAQSLVYSGKYNEALNLLDTIEDPSSDTARDIYNLKNDIYSAIESNISGLIAQGKTDEALEALKANEAIPSYDDLQNDIYEAIEAQIFALMDEGEYIDAQALLEENNFIANYDKLSNQIMYETMIIRCVFALRPNMKNPSSLQINSVEIYDVDDAAYPAFVMIESAQNGFGGYASACVVFDTDDLDYLGSCTSIYEPDDDDIAEQLTALLVRTYREKNKVIDDAPYDLSRINSFIPTGKMPNIDYEQYKAETDTSV